MVAHDNVKMTHEQDIGWTFHMNGKKWIIPCYSAHPMIHDSVRDAVMYTEDGIQKLNCNWGVYEVFPDAR